MPLTGNCGIKITFSPNPIINECQVESEVDEYFVTRANLYLNFSMNDQVGALAKEVLQLSPSIVAARELLT